MGGVDPAPLTALPDARLGQRGGVAGRVLVLNASYEAINVCTVRRAAVLVLKERAEILEQRGLGPARRVLRDAAAHGDPPEHLRARAARRAPRKITRRAIFARDHWTCQYCGTGHTSLTVDHVIPRSKGGTRRGTTSSPAARRATAARATGCPSRRTCTRRTSRGAPRHDLRPRRRARVPEVWQQYLVAA